MTLTTLILLILACWRIANLLTDYKELGPYEVLWKIRKLAGVKTDQYGIPYGETVLAEIFSCIWCMSVWVGLAIGLLYYLFPSGVENFVAIPFGLSGGLLLVHKYIRGN